MKSTEIKLPKKITPCPIIDALLEIRFSINTDPNAVFGQLYSYFKESFSKPESLPILQVPEYIRKVDPNFQFKPHYRLEKDGFILQIGSDVLTISSFPEYIGWNNFSEMIYEILKKVKTSDIIDRISRLGLRYVNFFELNIFDHINLDVHMTGNSITEKNIIIKTEINGDDFKQTLQISNHAQSGEKFGSIIDIDTFKDIELEDFFNNQEKLIEFVHLQEKHLFFSLLKDEFLQNFNPEY
ncbi:MAG: TIGR04255 family protein [bacterium]